MQKIVKKIKSKSNKFAEQISFESPLEKGVTEGVHVQCRIVQRRHTFNMQSIIPSFMLTQNLKFW